MRLSWSDHLNTARTLELAGRDHTGSALALMGVALLMLLQDLEQMPEAAVEHPSA
jgi:membrane protease subunit (stomatin/prohibitin family)